MSDQTLARIHLREMIAEEIRALMARRRVTGARLGLAIGKSDMYVSRRVRGETAFDVDDLEAIAEFFDVSVVDLMPASITRRRVRTTEGYAVRDPRVSTRPHDHRPANRDDKRRPIMLRKNLTAA